MQEPNATRVDDTNVVWFSDNFSDYLVGLVRTQASDHLFFTLYSYHLSAADVADRPSPSRTRRHIPSTADDLRACRKVLSIPEFRADGRALMAGLGGPWTALEARWDKLCEIHDREQIGEEPKGTTSGSMVAILQTLMLKRNGSPCGTALLAVAQAQYTNEFDEPGWMVVAALDDTAAARNPAVADFLSLIPPDRVAVFLSRFGSPLTMVLVEGYAARALVFPGIFAEKISSPSSAM